MLVCALLSSAYGQVAAFDLGSSFSLQGDARFHANRLELARGGGEQVGSAWVDNAFSLPDGGGFRAVFEVTLDPTVAYGGGGLVFALQGQSEAALGEGDLGMGYLGISPSVGIELDPWQSYGVNDPDDNHVGIDVNGEIDSKVARTVPFPIATGGSVFCRVDLASGELQVYLSTSPIGLSDPVSDPLVSLPLASLPDPLWVGFTASSGSDPLARIVRSFEFVADGDSDGDGVLDFEDTTDTTDTDDPSTDEPGTDDPGTDDPDTDASSTDTGDTALDLPRVFFCGCAHERASPGPQLLLLVCLWRRMRS